MSYGSMSGPGCGLATVSEMFIRSNLTYRQADTNILDKT